MLDEQVFAGLDIGGTKVLGVLIDADARVLRETRLPTVKGREGIVATAATMVAWLLQGAELPMTSLGAVGIGVPGLVNPGNGHVEHAVNLGMDGSVALAPLLSARLNGVPVHADNDLNAAAFGAAHLLRGHWDAATGAANIAGTGVADAKVADLAFLALGTGVAAGLVLDGVVRRGANGAAGELGHIPVVADGLACPCGQRGCLEQYASGAALDAAWPSRNGRPAPAELFDAARAGDPNAVRVRDTFAVAVAAAVRLLVLTCDVGRVVIGGGVSHLGTPLLDAVQAALREQAAGSPFLSSMNMAARVELAPRDMPVAAIGAALLGAARLKDSVTALSR
ncbi:MAG: glucokinase [Actinomycetota bacterium]|jgi:glucokinase|nr:glucokinase [Actinomycetota bacterium]